MTDPQVPLVAIWSGRTVASADELREALLRQIVNPVRWVEVVETLVANGSTTFLELGPGRVLSGLIRQIAPDSERSAAASPAAVAEFAADRP